MFGKHARLPVPPPPDVQESWPAGTQQAGDKAVQTPLADGRHLTITFPEVGGP